MTKRGIVKDYYLMSEFGRDSTAPLYRPNQYNILGGVPYIQFLIDNDPMKAYSQCSISFQPINIFSKENTL